MICTLCNGRTFLDYGGRTAVLCAGCNSLERHRNLHRVLSAEGELRGRAGSARALHLAPERPTWNYLKEAFGIGCFGSDPQPERYPHARPLRLRLPEGLDPFPDGYFDLIVHNHVLEHVPGSYRTVVTALTRVLAPGGLMAFTIPGLDPSRPTLEGGEHLATDAERRARFGQEDHVRIFGYDLLDFLRSLPGTLTIHPNPDGAATATVSGDTVLAFRARA